MRVIAGAYRGRRLKAPSWTGLRPTSDRLKETLFGVLADRVIGARVLDGFAGTGALGIEALSRGARAVTFVDEDPRAIALIRDNLRHCGITGSCAIIRGSFAGAVRRLPAAQGFDLVLLDPPYEQPDIDGVLAAGGGCVAPGGALVLEHARRREVPQSAGLVVRYRALAVGDSVLTFYQPVGLPVHSVQEET